MFRSSFPFCQTSVCVTCVLSKFSSTPLIREVEMLLFCTEKNPDYLAVFVLAAALGVCLVAGRAKVPSVCVCT